MEDLYKELRRIFENNPQMFEKRSRLQGILKDCIKQDLYINLLMNAYDINICDEFNKVNDLDELLINRLNRQLCKKYGVSDGYAKWSIVTWALACNKQIPEKAKIYLTISASQEEGQSTVIGSVFSEQNGSTVGKVFQKGRNFAENEYKTGKQYHDERNLSRKQDVDSTSDDDSDYVSPYDDPAYVTSHNNSRF